MKNYEKGWGAKQVLNNDKKVDVIGIRLKRVRV